MKDFFTVQLSHPSFIFKLNQFESNQSWLFFRCSLSEGFRWKTWTLSDYTSPKRKSASTWGLIGNNGNSLSLKCHKVSVVQRNITLQFPPFWTRIIFIHIYFPPIWSISLILYLFSRAPMVSRNVMVFQFLIFRHNYCVKPMTVNDIRSTFP